MKYLDENGLSYLWGKIKLLFATKDELSAKPTARIYYGTCSTTANTYIKNASVETFPLDSNNKPLAGTTVGIKFTVTNTYKTAGNTYQLNVNNTGDYPMYYNNAELATSTSANTLVAGYKNRYTFYMFNGTQWVFLSSSYDTNSTYSAMTLTEINDGSGTTGRTLTSALLRSNFYTEGEVDTLLSAKANSATTLSGYGITDANINNGVITLGSNSITPITSHQDISGKVNTSDLAAVATSGDYNDLDNKPTIPTVPTTLSSFTDDLGTSPTHTHSQYLTSHQDISSKADKSSTVSTVSYDSTNKKILKTINGTTTDVVTAATIVSDGGGITSHQDISGKANTSDLSAVATSGSYTDLLDKPTIPEALILSDWNLSDNTKKDFIKNKPTIPSLSGYATETWVGLLGYLTSFTETDPTVPSWAKASSKPSYTASEVGALPDSTTIPSALSDLSDDSTHRVVTDTEKSTWSGKQDALVSGTNIKTINNESLLGTGNISIIEGDSNIIEAITFNGSAVPVSSKTAAITVTIPDAQVQSDWNATTGMGVILNKPTIPTVPTNVSDFTNDAGYLTSHQDISGKADIATTLSGYGITDAKIENGVITLGSNTITPITSHLDISSKADKSATVSTVTYDTTNKKLTKTINGTSSDVVTAATIVADGGGITSHQDISGKADKATTLAGYGITDAKIVSGVITLGSETITPLTSHLDISGKADVATTLAGYGITDAKIANGVITLGSDSITPLTSHQDISGKANSADLATVATSGDYTDLLNAPQYVLCTLSAYNAMVSHDSNVYYIIISESNA